MKKNYFLKNATKTSTPLVLNCKKKSLKNIFKSLFLLLFTLLGFSDAFGQVTINTANGSINSCTYPTSYVALGNIFLEENQNANFGFAFQNFDYTFIITAPANFEFEPGVGSVAFRGGEDITAASVNVTANTITVTYRSNQMNRTNGDDRLTISGINFRGITAPSTGNMTRTTLGGGTGVINGAGSGSVYGTLTSTNNPLPSNGGGAATVCVGASTPAFTNATGGGTWSIIPITGNATVTGGGVVTGTSAGTVTVRYTLNGCVSNSALTVNPAPAAIGGGAATVCTGVSTPAFTNATPGGTWSVIPAGGTASITAGGILTGTTAGNVRVRYTLPSGCFIETANIAVQQTPGAITGGAATVCVGSSTPAFTNPNGGGTWSVLNGTGAATITSPGGVLTGTTAGTVTVRYTIGSCTPATYNVTVNPAPAAIAGGATTVCVGGTTPAFTNATAGGTWSTSNANATINASGVLTGVTSGTVRVIYTLPTGCFVQTALITINSLPTTVATPTPTNGATGVCYAGAGAVTSISWGAVAGATSYDVYFGAGSVPATVTANVATNTYNTGALAANTTYYWRIVAKNACGDAPTSATFRFTTSGSTCYCASSGSTFSNGITGVNFNTINNLNTAVNVAYSDYTYLSTSIVKTLSYNLSVFVNTGGNFTDYQSVYIDWNGNGSFADAGEFYSLGTATNVTNGLTSLSPLSITVPAGAITGSVRMRIQSRWNNTTTGPCQTGFDGEVEDYMLNIVAATPCTTPTAQPTALNLTAGGSIISGSFTASAPAANSYLVIIGTSATPPAAPVNGTNYTIGSVYQAGGYTVLDIDNNTIFAATGLSASTTYYFYIYSYNNLCTGGPLYLGTSPLTGNATTTALTYCEPTTTLATEFITGVASVGTINDVSNTSGYSPGGYANYSSIIIATQIPGGGINLNVNFNPFPGEAQFIKTWVDWNNNNVFEDPAELVYTTGNTATGPTSFGFIIPGAQALGDYRMRIKTRNFGGTASGNSTYTPCSSHDRGETEDYTIRVIADCTAKITGVTNGSACGPTNTVNLSATMSAGSTEIRWYTTLTGGASIHTGTTFTTPSIATTTTYYVTAWNGSCETYHRTPVVATILPTSNITVTPSVPEVCGEGNVVQITATGDFLRETIFTQNFESGMAPFTVTTPLNTNGGADTPWSVKPSPYQPTTTSVWRPAVNSGPVGSTGNSFAFTTSDYNNSNIQTIMTSPAIDASLYNSLTLTFDHYYSAFGGDFGEIQVATNAAGTDWTAAIQTYNTDLGSASIFTGATVDLTPYAGTSTLRFRFIYNGTWDDGWAIDNIKLEGIRPLNTTFTWTGGTVEAFTDAACTTLYTNQAVTNIYVRPTPLQLASPSWSFTANATLGNGCTIAQPITITNKTKLWKGTSDNNWYNPNNWEPIGVPDANTCVYIYPGSPAANTSNINTIANDAFAKVVTVRPSGVLNIHPNNDLTVTDAVTVDAGGTFNIENTGSLIQVNNVANSGIISMKRNATIKALDYVYWSSPVASFASNAISPATPTSVIWKWEPTTATPYLNQFGNWVNGNETMTIGRGYIVRSPNGWPTANTTFTANFVGVPNNGTITRPITRWTYTGVPTAGPTSTPVTENDDNWNLLGNPYPSAIDAIAFLSANATHINGYVDLWTHGNAPAAIADPFYQDYQLNYNPNDYLRYNNTGGTQFGFDGKIGAGQGFFVLMRDAGSTTENVTFTNAMRSRTHRNDQFFRTSETNEITTEIERHRIWLKMVAPNLVSTDMLIGYVAGATNTLDDSFDAMNRGIKVNYELYSLAENKGLLIQGRALPFDANDQIPLGVKIAQNGIHTIAISAADGLFGTTTQDIYLEDRTLGITHDLRTVPYSFTATPGTYENRFVLKFNNETLGNEDFITNNVTVYTNESINISAPNQVIKSVRVHDLLGRVLGTFNNVNSNTFSSKNIAKTQSPLLVEVTLENGATKTYKVIF